MPKYGSFGGVAIAASLAIGLAASANAQVYDNLNTAAQTADCSFSTTCASVLGRGNEFAAQLFTLDSVSEVTLGVFTELDNGRGQAPTSVNYAIYADKNGLPGGPALSSGQAAIGYTNGFGVISGLNVSMIDFAMTPTILQPGRYFFAIQAVSPYFDAFLQQGRVASGAAESQDGGLTWRSGYETGANGAALGGLSMALYNTIPEPAAWAVMLVGFAGVGAVLRRRRIVARIREHRPVWRAPSS